MMDVDYAFEGVFWFGWIWVEGDLLAWFVAFL
jgi:hypothetical protein